MTAPILYLGPEGTHSHEAAFRRFGAKATLVPCLSLVAIGLGRLINTGMTAAMPKVVPDRILAATNSALVTIGSVITAVGAVAAFAVLAVLGLAFTSRRLEMLFLR